MTKKPSYRFVGYTEPWEEKKLGEVAEVNPKSVVPDEFKYVDLGAVVGTEMVSYRNETISTSPSRAQRLAVKGDVFYQTVRPYQKNNYLFRKDDNDYVFSTGYAQLRPNGDGCFLLSYLQTNKFVNVVLDNCTGTSYPAINSKDLSDIFISLPSVPEQTAIGSFFQDIDQLISLQQRKLEVLKEQKKTYLKLLFPAKGQTKPALRFAGFEDDWKEVKLGEIADYKNGKGYEDRQSDSGSYELINLNSISIDGGLKRSGKFIDKADETLEKGDLVMVLSDVAHGNLLGRVAIIPESNKFVLNQRVALLRPRLNSNSEFLYSYINSNQYYFKTQGAGMSQLNISRSSVENFSVYFPTLPEQEAIGSFFQDLDKAIAKQEEKVIQLKESKQTLLRKMFI